MTTTTTTSTRSLAAGLLALSSTPSPATTAKSIDEVKKLVGLLQR